MFSSVYKVKIKTFLKIIEPFQNHVLQWNGAKTSNIPLFAVHEIIKRVRESGYIQDKIKKKNNNYYYWK